MSKKEITQVPCQGCGKPIMVTLPFVGCPFCEKCNKQKSYVLGTEDFTHNES